MISAPLPPDERERLEALYAYDILDTEAEKVFDDLALLASEICETPIALISLVDPNRQWFKAKVGIDAEQTSRDIAFCAHAIHHTEVFEVSDTLKDKRFVDNPLVTSDPNIRFYAGAQLMTPDGHAIGTLCAIDSKPHQLNEQQRNALEILGREVISQMELRCKVKQLEKASQHKSDFLSNISHELRTPLNAIVNFSRLMLSDVKQQPAPNKLSEYATYIDAAGKHLLNLVNSVLDMSKIEEGKLPLELAPTDVRQMFEQVQGVMSVQADEKSIELTAQIDESVPQYLQLDESKVKQIVLNLLGNAIKFTPQGGKVGMSLSMNQQQLNLKLQDTGCGISEQDQKRLFNKFEQVGKNRGTQGTGLGLTITKGLVELMQGKITLSSELDKGTTIAVNLPVSACDDQFQANSTCDVQLQSDCGQRILLVEDTPINQQVAKAVFSAMGLSIDLAETGEQAIEMVGSTNYDIVFMDLHLPGLDGYQSAEQINRQHPKLPIIALTADVFYDKTDKAQVFKDKLTKPLETEKLIQILNLWGKKP